MTINLNFRNKTVKRDQSLSRKNNQLKILKNKKTSGPYNTEAKFQKTTTELFRTVVIKMMKPTWLLTSRLDKN